MFDIIQAFKDIANKISSLKTAIDDKLPLNGGTLTGNLNGKYITGTWLQATESNHLSSSPSRFCVQDDSGWLYHRTASEIVSDIGAAKSGHSHAINDKFAVSEHTTDSLSTNASTTASSATLSISKSGYYPLGIVGVSLAGTNYMYVNLFNYYLSAQNDGSGTITYRYRNNSTATFSGTIKFKVLWVKTT